MTVGRVVSVGTDIIECDRIANMIAKHGDAFLQRVYTPAEIAYCSARKACVQHYAGRWAAKEATLKALGTGWTNGIRWVDVEVTNVAGGAPVILLHGRASEVAHGQQINKLLTSISHCRTHAIAYVTAMAGEM